MLNPELLRRDLDRTRATLARRDQAAVEAFNSAVTADERWRQLTVEVESLRAERKQRSSGIGGAPTDEERAAMRELGTRLSTLEQELQQAEDERNQAIGWVPNLPDPSVPPGV